MHVIATADVDPNEVLAIVSVADLKANLRITHNKEDTICRQCILAAYDWLANPELGFLNRAIITQTYSVALPGFVKAESYSDRGVPSVRYVPASIIMLPKPPLVTVQTVKYLASGVLTTLAGDQYTVNTKNMFGNVALGYQLSWPTVDVSQEAVQINYTAGYGTGAQVKTKCPGIVQAMLLLAGDAYENREDTYAEPRLVAVNRRTVNGVLRYAGRYRIMNRHA